MSLLLADIVAKKAFLRRRPNFLEPLMHGAAVE
jgi:hypothetical protein